MANRFLRRGKLRQPEPRYPLYLFFCPLCALMQLGVAPPPEEIFSDYAYASSTSASFREHFRKLADTMLMKGLVKRGDRVVEVGSNDGILLKPLRELGIEAVGVEPATNLCELARQEGLVVLNEFFTEATVDRLGRGSADAVVACNVWAHIPEIQAATQNVYDLLKPEGFFCIEVQDVAAMLSTGQFDNIYLEHIFYWSAPSLRRFLGSQGFHVFNMERIDTHGGSLRVWADKGMRTPFSGSLNALFGEAHAQGVDDIQAYKVLGQRARSVRSKLREFLKSQAENGKVVVGFGAPAKSTTLLNYCGIGRRWLPYIVDDSPLKQGSYTPGTHIPIFSPMVLEEKRPDYILILAWNFAEPIMRRWRHLGVPFILPTQAGLDKPV